MKSVMYIVPLCLPPPLLGLRVPLSLNPVCVCVCVWVGAYDEVLHGLRSVLMCFTALMSLIVLSTEKKRKKLACGALVYAHARVCARVYRALCHMCHTHADGPAFSFSAGPRVFFAPSHVSFESSSTVFAVYSLK